MEDLTYWLGQIALVEFELVGMILLIVLPIMWIIGAIAELSAKIRNNKLLYLFKKGEKK